MSQLPVYYINLASAPGRREEMEKQFAALQLTAARIEAVTPKEVTPQQLEAFCNPERYRWLAPEELSCTLSHIKIWKDLVNSGHSHGVVFEDDAIVSRQLPTFLSLFPRDMQCIVKLETSTDPLRSETRARQRVGEIELRRTFGFNGGSAGYIIPTAVAATILEWTDAWSLSIDRILFDSMRRSRKARFLQADPGLAIQARKWDQGRPAEMIESSILPANEARLKVRPRSTWRRFAYTLLDLAEYHLNHASQKAIVDALGYRKRSIGFLP